MVNKTSTTVSKEITEMARRLLANNVCVTCGGSKRVIYRTEGDFPLCHGCHCRDFQRTKRGAKLTVLLKTLRIVQDLEAYQRGGNMVYKLIEAAMSLAEGRGDKVENRKELKKRAKEICKVTGHENPFMRKGDKK